MLQILGMSRGHRAFPDADGGQGLAGQRQLQERPALDPAPCTCWPPDLHRDPQSNAQNEGIAGEELREAALAQWLTAHFLWTPDEPGLCSAAQGSQGES